MTVSERLQQLIIALQNSISGCRTSLQEKGVAVPSSMKLNQISGYINLVSQTVSDFNWMFNFKDIDQFGNPYVPTTGNPIAPGKVEQFYTPGYTLIPDPSLASAHDLLIFDFANINTYPDVFQFENQ